MMNLQKLCTIAMVALAAWLPSAQAAVTSGMAGSSVTVIDPLAGKEWLRLDYTINQTPTQALAQFGALGFHLANRAEVFNLINNSFHNLGTASLQNQTTPVPNAEADLWIQYFGLTINMPGNQYNGFNGTFASLGLFDNGLPNIFGRSGFVSQFDSFLNTTNSYLEVTGGLTAPAQNAGIFLVRDLTLPSPSSAVPAPATLALTAFALLALKRSRRRLTGDRT